MKAKKILIFDFDGTIANTLPIWFETYNEIAPEFKTKQIKTPNAKIIRSSNMRELMEKLNVSPVKLPFLLFKIKQKLGQKIEQAEMFNGLTPIFKKLKSDNFILGILTSNSQANVRFFLKNKKLNKIFDFIYTGKNLHGKDKVIKRLLKTKNILPSQAIYIGDEVRDIEAAKKVNIPIISVSWGLNDSKTLEKSHPNFIVDNPLQLLNTIKKMS